MRVVLDANVLVSAAISEGPSHRIVHGWLRDETFELVICDWLLGEVRSVLTERPRLRKWISMEAAERYLATLATIADVRPDPAPGPAMTRDPDDECEPRPGSAGHHRLSLTVPALVAQLDRASDYGSEGWGFESSRARC